MAPKFLSITFLCVCLSSIEAINDVSFSVDLIHRDSPKSPFYNPSDSPYVRMKKAVRRSISRTVRFKPFSNPLNQYQPDVIPNAGEYLMNISIGTPPVQFLGIVDTGSDLIWTQCKPCNQCYNQTIPIFDPEHSSSYRGLSCTTQPCRDQRGSCANDNCVYNQSYADTTFSAGNLATETLTISSVALPNIVVGCGHDNVMQLAAGGNSGIIGFGVSHVSLISQISSNIDGKFSYCFVPFDMYTSSSKMNFGRKGIVSGEGVVSTPMYTHDYYYLTLESISVGGSKLAYQRNQSKTNANLDGGNIIIDSGTTLTYLENPLYSQVEAAVKEAIYLESVKDPREVFLLCYNASTVDDLKVPLITFHFAGADVVLQPVNTFVRVDDRLICLGIHPDSLAVFGNIATTNFLVGYDLQTRTVSFKPTDCSKN